MAKLALFLSPVMRVVDGALLLPNQVRLFDILSKMLRSGGRERESPQPLLFLD